MHRLAILSDIHGNFPALQAVMNDMQNDDISQVIVAGDLINNVPFNAEVMQTALENRWACIRGNHEFYLLNRDTKREKGFRKGSTTTRSSFILSALFQS